MAMNAEKLIDCVNIIHKFCMSVVSTAKSSDIMRHAWTDVVSSSGIEYYLQGGPKK